MDHVDLGTDTASLLAELKEWDTASPADEWFTVEDEGRQWNRFIHRLLRQLEAAAAAPGQSS